MTGMFQSSNTASGIARLHASSAFSPSSASAIWKSRPSRMRRATLRMTLESSTTRQVFIWGLQLLPFRVGLSCRHQVRHDFENAIDVEHDHELAVEAVDAAGQLGHARVEIDRIFLAALFGQPQHLA